MSDLTGGRDVDHKGLARKDMFRKRNARIAFLSRKRHTASRWWQGQRGIVLKVWRTLKTCGVDVLVTNADDIQSSCVPGRD